MLRELWRDKTIRVYVGLLGLVLLPYFFLRDSPDQLSLYADGYAGLPLQVFLAAVLLSFAYSKRKSAEGFFWAFFGSAQFLWMLAGLIPILVPFAWYEDPLCDQVQDVLFVGGYFLVALAVTRRPDYQRAVGANKKLRRIQSIGTAVLFFGFLVYFAGIPKFYSGDLETTLFANFVPSMLLYVTADLFLILCVTHAFWTCTSKVWRSVYGMLLAMTLAWFGVDILESLLYSGTIPWIDAGSLRWDLIWFVPDFFALFAVRWRALKDSEYVSSSARPDPDSSIPLPWGGPVVLYAIGLPCAHILINSTGALDPVTLTYREVWVLMVVAVLAMVAFVYQRVLEAENRRLEEAHRSVDEQLLVAQRMEAVGRLAGGMAHDFNNVLQVVLACAELQLSEKEAEDPDREGLTQITTAAQRAAALTGQLLTVVRRERNAPRPLDINEVVSDMGLMLQRVLGEDIQLRWDLAPDLPLIEADRGELEQVVMNIAINARDAMEQGGVLEIRTLVLDPTEQPSVPEAAPGQRAVLVLSDSGQGMSEDVRTRMYEPFFTTKGDQKGTGLGLSMVYGIMQRNGGQISVQSEPGVGSSFRLSFPVLEHSLPTPCRAQAPGDSEEAGERRSETILVVEDEEPVRELTLQLLRSLGYRTIGAPSGESALDLLATHEAPIDLVLTDVIMSGIKGPDLRERIQELYPGTAVVFMSGYGGDAWEGIDRTHFAGHLLRKPYKRKDLAEMVRAALVTNSNDIIPNMGPRMSKAQVPANPLDSGSSPHLAPEERET